MNHDLELAKHTARVMDAVMGLCAPADPPPQPRAPLDPAEHCVDWDDGFVLMSGGYNSARPALRKGYDLLIWFDMDAEARKVAQRAINKERQMALNQQEAWAWGFGRDARSARQKHDYRMIEIENEERRNAGQVCEHHPDGMMWWKLPNGERVDA